jgi:hypothetical protein
VFLASPYIGPLAVADVSKFTASCVIGRRGRRIILKPIKTSHKPAPAETGIQPNNRLASVNSAPVFRAMKHHSSSIMLHGYMCPAVWMRLTGGSGGRLTCRDSDLVFDGYLDLRSIRRRISSNNIEFAFIRRSLDRNIVCDLFTTNSKSYFFSMNETHLRDFFTYLTQSVTMSTSELPELAILHLLRSARPSICRTIPSIDLVGKIKLTAL